MRKRQPNLQLIVNLSIESCIQLFDVVSHHVPIYLQRPRAGGRGGTQVNRMSRSAADIASASDFKAGKAPTRLKKDSEVT